jgi:hypothetical protein
MLHEHLKNEKTAMIWRICGAHCAKLGSGLPHLVGDEKRKNCGIKWCRSEAIRNIPETSSNSLYKPLIT